MEGIDPDVGRTNQPARNSKKVNSIIARARTIDTMRDAVGETSHSVTDSSLLTVRSIVTVQLGPDHAGIPSPVCGAAGGSISGSATSLATNLSSTGACAPSPPALKVNGYVTATDAPPWGLGNFQRLTALLMQAPTALSESVDS